MRTFVEAELLHFCLTAKEKDLVKRLVRCATLSQRAEERKRARTSREMSHAAGGAEWLTQRRKGAKAQR